MEKTLEIFLKCDISGIQSFIFNVPSQGAAKEIKRRSMFVEDISKFCFYELEDFFKEDSLRELYNGGGNFYLEISTKKTKQEIESKIEDIQKLYLESDIYPYITYIEKSTNDIGQLLMDVNRAVQKEKMQRRFSTELIDSKPIKLSDDKINEIKGINGQIPNGDFSWIAERAEGDKKLAAIKLDVDNLGSLFMGLSESDYKKLSSEIKYFFDAKLLELIHNMDMKDNIYVVFSGGDDCFMIGSWSHILNLALRLRNEFDIFQKQIRKAISSLPDSEINFSAGIVVFTPHYPMLQVAEEAEDALDASKRTDGKNSVSLFGKTLTWDEFVKSQKVQNTLTQLIQEKKESKSLLMIFRTIYPQKNELPKVWRLKYFLRRNIQSANLDEVKTVFKGYELALLFRYLNQEAENPDIYLVASRWSELLMKNKNK